VLSVFQRTRVGKMACVEFVRLVSEYMLMLTISHTKIITKRKPERENRIYVVGSKNTRLD
jgi:hypothetical protein